jgi:hypothetical protein
VQARRKAVDEHGTTRYTSHQRLAQKMPMMSLPKRQAEVATIRPTTRSARIPSLDVTCLKYCTDRDQSSPVQSSPGRAQFHLGLIPTVSCKRPWLQEPVTTDEAVLYTRNGQSLTESNRRHLPSWLASPIARLSVCQLSRRLPATHARIEGPGQ